MGWLQGATKVGLIVGAAYGSYAVGVWSKDTRETKNIYEKVTREIVPGPLEIKKNLPSTTELERDVKYKWNNSMNCVFNYINSIPSKCTRLLQNAFSALKKEKIDAKTSSYSDK
uniref:MICOS complex subunit MIC13 n=1 Tax=Acrobeloides nanus TaxID=290746 RepID=A0A914D0L6_9BILA